MKFLVKTYLIFRSLITYLLWSVISIFFMILLFPLVWLPASVRYDNRLFYWISSLWNRALFLVAGIYVKVVNSERIPLYPQQPSVFVMNHASSLDIFVIEMLLREYPRIWISKMAYKYIPLFSTLLQRMHVLVDIASPRSAARSLAKMVGLARNEKRHTLIFPEGGRFTDGKIRPFFGGFVVLARKLNRPVVPAYIRNASTVLNPKGYLINNLVPLEVEVGTMFEIEKDETDEMFSARVRDWFCQQAEKKA